jgi:hypothetical protein
VTKEPRAPRRAVLPPDPSFWFGFEITWAKVVVFRVVFFGMLALDALLQIRHAPRYGANAFNVAQLPLLDDLGPGCIGYGVGQLLLAYLLVVGALGVATRWVIGAAALLYAWLYLGSQLDSYQHHYLVMLVLAISAFVPWQRPYEAHPRTPVRSWALRLVLVQLAIMYLWAAISKMDGAWLDGTTLGKQLAGSMRSLIDHPIGIKWTARFVILVELGLAAPIWLKRTWWIAAPIGIVFHLGIVATGLEIGLFAYLMVAIYVLVIPDVVIVSILELEPLQPIARALRRIAAAPGWIAIGVGIALGLVIALITRTPAALITAIIASVVPIGIAAMAAQSKRTPPASVGIAHVVALLAWLVVDRASTVTEDYYRFWGGSQRRLGNPETAEIAYRKLVEIEPDDPRGHFQLARLLLANGKDEEGLDHLHAAQGREDLARAWLEEARWLAKAGRTAEALEKARSGLRAEPTSNEARALVDSLAGSRPLPTPATDSEP